MTAKQNIAKLPDRCWAVNLVTGKLIVIRAGESGYYPVNFVPESISEGRSMDELANLLNSEEGISIQQRMAMEHGSMFGWRHGLANPDRWSIDGKPISLTQNA